jgi:sialate O-acetylesterase
MKRLRLRAYLVAFGLATVASHALAAPLAVNPLFGDHMVLQRGRPIEIRGEGVAGSTVTVRFAGATAQATVGDDGRWAATLPPISEGAGDLEISDSAGGALRLGDVATGDVFLCSGQSNMDLPVSDTAYPRRTADEGDGMAVRLLKIRRTSSPRAGQPLIAEIAWAAAGPSSLPGFSAACWHMARKLADADVGATIGLVQASWGGASIEDWLAPDALKTIPAYQADEQRLDRYAGDAAAATAEVVAATDAWAVSADPEAAGDGFSTATFDASGWPEITLPGSWERSGIEGLASFDGLMWFRRDLVLTEEQAARPAVLNLGRIDERDQVWINGEVVGATLVAGEARRYPVRAGLLRAGRNTIAIRVLDERGAGGLMGRRADLRLELEDSTAVNLAGSWRYHAGPARRAWTSAPPFVPWTAPRGLSTMWNGMIAPLEGFPLKGVAWYQGETNTADADGYAELLQLWASSWRQFFNDPALPLVVAQLPGYGPRSTAPSNGDWPRLREAQRLVAAADPNMGLAVLIDLGVSYDIHPAHKDEVGDRLGNEMLRLAYGRNAPRAPSPLDARKAADGIRLRFAHAEGGLVAYGSHDAATFELCDAHGSCRFVPARVEGDVVILPADADAREVRYAWQGSPPVNLYGANGLPVTPFALALPAHAP